MRFRRPFVTNLEHTQGLKIDAVALDETKIRGKHLVAEAVELEPKFGAQDVQHTHHYLLGISGIGSYY